MIDCNQEDLSRCAKSFAFEASICSSYKLGSLSELAKWGNLARFGSRFARVPLLAPPFAMINFEHDDYSSFASILPNYDGKDDTLGQVVHVDGRSLLSPPFLECRIVASCMQHCARAPRTQVPCLIWQHDTPCFVRSNSERPSSILDGKTSEGDDSC